MDHRVNPGCDGANDQGEGWTTGSSPVVTMDACTPPPLSCPGLTRASMGWSTQDERVDHRVKSGGDGASDQGDLDHRVRPGGDAANDQG